jgi:hypothetical protein
MKSITKSKIYNISSTNALKQNGTQNSYVKIPIPNLIQKSDNILNLYFSILHAEVPNSFYLVNSSNNTIVINSTTYTVASGNYNALTLKTALLAVLPSGFQITYDQSSFKYTFTYTTSFTITTSSTIFPVIGGGTTTLTSVGNSITMPYIINFLPPPRIIFKSKNLRFNNFNQGDYSTDMFLCVQNSGNVGSRIYFQNFTNLRFLYEGDLTTDLSILEINVCDDNGTLLDFNNQHWFITFQIDIEFIPTDLGESFSSAVPSMNNKYSTLNYNQNALNNFLQ